MINKDGKKKASYNVPIGPIHPALKEPCLFNFKMNGEVVEEADFVSLTGFVVSVVFHTHWLLHAVLNRLQKLRCLNVGIM